MDIKKSLLIIVILITLVGCNNKANNTPNVKDGGKEETITSDDKIDEQLEEQPPQQLNDGIKYVNDLIGYSLVLPNSWEECYTIFEQEDGRYVNILFIGTSNLGKGPEGNGLYMFSIIREDVISDVWDSVKEIGKFKGQNYYYATGTDFSIGGLKDHEDESVNNDFKKAMSMLEDVPKILETIKAID